jgi:uncharacterized membrane protein YphA (DoxX/SURF4 family)
MGRAGDGVLLFARLLIAFLFFRSAYSSYQNLDGFTSLIESHRLPRPSIWGDAIIAIEIVLPAALALGVFARLTALALAAFVVVSSALLPEHRDLQTSLAILGGLLFYIFSGPGSLSVDGLLTPSSPMTLEERKLYYERLTAWGAVATGLGTIIAFFTLAIAALDFNEARRNGAQTRTDGERMSQPRQSLRGAGVSPSFRVTVWELSKDSMRIG